MSKGPKITAEDLLQDLAELVKEYGADHADQNPARYVVDGKPACLAGHILVKHKIIRIPEKFNIRVFVVLARQMRLMRRFTPEAVVLLSQIQRWQDNEWPWGRVEEWAKYEVDGRRNQQ